mmetsp:Transcript_84658/g.141119  ORF Transcript_84658/g.141119 Transcript_84658/m.141119 type:complete len:95 (+) Transcript_84658:86-370(+)
MVPNLGRWLLQGGLTICANSASFQLLLTASPGPHCKVTPQSWSVVCGRSQMLMLETTKPSAKRSNFGIMQTVVLGLCLLKLPPPEAVEHAGPKM